MNRLTISPLFARLIVRFVWRGKHWAGIDSSQEG